LRAVGEKAHVGTGRRGAAKRGRVVLGDVVGARSAAVAGGRQVRRRRGGGAGAAGRNRERPRIDRAVRAEGPVIDHEQQPPPAAVILRRGILAVERGHRRLVGRLGGRKGERLLALLDVVVIGGAVGAAGNAIELGQVSGRLVGNGDVNAGVGNGKLPAGVG